MSEEVTDDRFLNGRLRLLQPKRGHRFGGDAALLAAGARSLLAEGAAAADFGAGVGAVGLALGVFGAGRVALVEIDPTLAAIAAQNAGRNGLGEKAQASTCDVASLCRPGAPQEIAAGAFDLVAANPPFDDAARFRASPDAAKALAHMGDGETMAIWAAAAERALKPGGAFVAICRAEALPEALAAVDGAFGEVSVKPIHPRADRPASRILISARKGARGPLALLPALVMHGPEGGFTPEADAAQRGEAAIDMGAGR